MVWVGPVKQAAFEAALGQAQQPYCLLGTVTGGACVIGGEAFPATQQMKERDDTSLEKIMEQKTKNFPHKF